MTDMAPTSGEAGYWARRVRYARELRVFSGYVPARPPRRTSDELDPHHRPPSTHERAGEALYLADQTPGLDEAHCHPGHPAYQPKGS